VNDKSKQDEWDGLGLPKMSWWQRLRLRWTMYRVLRGKVGKKPRDWIVPLTRIEGKKGERIPVEVKPHCLFRTRRFVAGDSLGGHGTGISGVFVGQKNQSPGVGAVPTFALSSESTLGDWTWDTCDPALTITVMVEFYEDCVWSGALFGKCVF
jgi:hypothetical protein